MKCCPPTPFTSADAAMVPRRDIITSMEAYWALLLLSPGPLSESPDAPFKWWLFVPNLPDEVVGSGLVSCILETKWDEGVQIALRTADATTERVQIIRPAPYLYWIVPLTFEAYF